MIRRALLAATSVRQVPGTARETGAYCSELADFWEALTGAGWTVELATPGGGVVPLEAVDDDSRTQRAMLADPAMASQLDHSPTFAETRGEFGLTAVIGGHGAVWDLTTDTALAEHITATHAAGGVVAAVCHGAVGLFSARHVDDTPLVAGRRIAAFTDEEERAVGMASVVPFFLSAEIARRGGRHDTGGSFLPHVVVDDRVVTGQNPASAPGAARKAIETAESGAKVAPLR